MQPTVVLVVILLASCTGGFPRETTPVAPATASSAGPTETAVSLAPRETTTSPPSTACTATLPNGDNPPGGQDSRLSHGNGRLWVVLWPRGHVQAHEDDVRPDGSLAIKFPWTRGVKGSLSITGRRLDADAPPAQAEVPDGYGNSGFQSTAVIFPTPGCWKITGRVGRASLTFVTKVTGPGPRDG